MRASCRLDVLERERLAGVLLADRTAQELVAVEHPDFGQVARIVADGDGLADIGGQDRIDVAQSLEMNAVAPHAARLGEHDEQQVEVLQAFGDARQEALPRQASSGVSPVSLWAGRGRCRQ